MNDLKDIVAKVCMTFCFCFLIFNLRSCEVESKKLRNSEATIKHKE